MKKSAFLYRNDYYLVPEGYAGFDAFVDAIKRDYESQSAKCPIVKVIVSKLSERRCIPPYFVSDHARDFKLKIRNPKALFETEAELLTMKEYNNRLRALVKGYCSGCRWYGEVNEKDSSLKGHHEEISLDGVCFTRTEREAEPVFSVLIGFQRWMLWFEENKADLEVMIDLGQYRAAEEEIAGALDDAVIPKPPFVFAGKRGKEYFCAFSSGMNDVLGLLLSYLCVRANEQKSENWKFYEYIPKDVLDCCGEKFPLPAVRVGKASPGTPMLKLTLGLPDDDAEGFIPYYFGLCNALGENRLRNAAMEYETTKATVEDDGIASLALKVEAALKILRTVGLTEDRIVVPPFLLLATGNQEGTEPEMIATVRVPRLFEAAEQAPETIYQQAEELGWLAVPVGVLKANGPALPVAEKPGTVPWDGGLWLEEVMKAMEVLSKKGYIKIFAHKMLPGSTELYFLIMKKDAAIMSIRRLSPMFERSGAVLTVIDPDFIREYEVGFGMKLLSERAMDIQRQ